MTILTYLNASDENSFLMKISPWSPDWSPCNFFLWACVKGLVYVPLIPASIDELK